MIATFFFVSLVAPFGYVTLVTVGILSIIRYLKKHGGLHEEVLSA